MRRVLRGRGRQADTRSRRPLLLGVDKGCGSPTLIFAIVPADDVRFATRRKGKEREQTCDAAEPVVEPTRQRWQDLPAHRDENQVALDVKRSFIYYPQSAPPVAPYRSSCLFFDVDSGITDEQKATLRSLLSWLILATLRRHPQLSYFQGYHDIVSVILLSLVPFETLTPTSLDPVDEDHNVGEGAERFGIEEADLELLERCVERLSLHRIRDSMGKGMDPVMGYLRCVLSVSRGLHLLIRPEHAVSFTPSSSSPLLRSHASSPLIRLLCRSSPCPGSSP